MAAKATPTSTKNVPRMAYILQNTAPCESTDVAFCINDPTDSKAELATLTPIAIFLFSLSGISLVAA